MRVVLLAAGSATRLRPLTDRLPKCLLEVGERTILSRTIELLAARGLRRFTVVDGFCADALHSALRGEFPAEWFTFVHNARFAETNNGYSLWLARTEPVEPMLLLDSDVLCDAEVLDRLLAYPEPDCIAVRNRGEVGAEEMKVELGPDGRVRAIAKTLAPAAAVGESVGIHRFGADWSARLFATLEQRMADGAGEHEYYEHSFQRLLDAGAALWPVMLDELRSLEIDTPEDLARARATFGRPTSPRGADA